MGPTDWPSAEVPVSTVPEAGIRREIFRVAGVVPPPNPLTGTATPDELNFTQVVRYRADVSPPAAAHAILIAYPGFLGGAGNWDPLARTLVRRSIAAGQPIEVWSIDRRSNLMEDLTGFDTAEATGNAEIAAGYYFGRDTIDGEEFPGFRQQADLAFESEWGLATHVEDLRRVLALVPAGERRARVFLMGHSLGASFTEAYAGWRFDDGLQGVDELAGLILIEGLLPETPLAQADYEGGVANGFFSLVGVNDIRATTRHFELPLIGSTVLPLAEIMSLRALYKPDAITPDDNRDTTLRILYLLAEIPPMTNAAVLGFSFDRESLPLTFAAASIGHGTGGPIESYLNPFGEEGAMLVHPTDPAATYDWVDAPDDDPAEVTPLANLAHAFVDGRTNLAEWYFPARLPIDLQACGGGRVAENGYQAAAGLRCFDGAFVDAPVLAISAELQPLANFEALKQRVTPTVGAGRPLANADRTNPAAWTAIAAEGFTHMDPLLASDVAANPVAGAVMTFVGANTAAGAVTIPLQP